MMQDPVELLERFVAREGHALVPKAHVEEVLRWDEVRFGDGQ
jgi:hypothetical protein